MRENEKEHVNRAISMFDQIRKKKKKKKRIDRLEGVDEQRTVGYERDGGNRWRMVEDRFFPEFHPVVERFKRRDA